MKAVTQKSKKGASKKINTLFSIDVRVKKDAQRAASRIDIPLSSIVNNYLYYFSRVAETALEYPSPRLVRAIESARKNVKDGDVSPSFTNAHDAIEWLNKQ